MPTIKIYPPSQLPDRLVSETQFNIWVEELEVYLSQEKDFEVFLKGGNYENWESAETNPDRILEVKPEDRVQVGGGVDANTARQRNNDKVQKLRKDIRTDVELPVPSRPTVPVPSLSRPVLSHPCPVPVPYPVLYRSQKGTGTDTIITFGPPPPPTTHH